ncbi:hypothetical protein C0992_011231, partial [Termitomyces sp. T32_za158]
MPGMDTMQSKSRPKSEAHSEVAQIIFGDHLTYKEAFAAAAEPKDLQEWGRKIKNRIQAMTTKCKKWLSSTGIMSETGQGVKRGADIDMSRKNALTTAWSESIIACSVMFKKFDRFYPGKVQDDCPWFFEFMVLVNERPNATTHGLANSGDAFDTDILGDGPDGEDTTGSDGQNIPDAGFDDKNGDKHGGNRAGDAKSEFDELAEHFELPLSTVNSHSIDTENASLTTPQPTTKANALEANTKGKSVQNKFHEIAIKEEETTQAAINSKIEKFRMRMEKEQHDIKLQAEVQMNRDKLQAAADERRH